MNSTADILSLIINISINNDSVLNDTRLKYVLDSYIEMQKKAIEHETYDQPNDCQNLSKIVDILYWYYVPFVILIGLIGNLLSCFVFLKTHLKLRSSSYYLAALSGADFGFLVSISFVWLNNKFAIPIFNKPGWCQAMVYISSVCSFLSVWFIVAFTVERFIAVQYPLHRPRMCTISRAKSAVVILTSASLLIHSYTLITAGVTEEKVCELRESYHEIMRVINIVDTVITLIIPIALIFTMNAMIMRNLIQFSRKFKSQEENATLDHNDTIVLNIMQSSSSNNSNRDGRQCYPIHESDEINEGSFHSCGNNNSRLNFHSSHQQYPALKIPISHIFQPSTIRSNHMRASCGNLMSTKTQQNITKMLLLISTVFISLNFPSYFIRLYIFFRFSIWKAETPEYLWCIQQLFMLLYYTNFSVNFLLYSMYGITFRRCLCQLIRNFYKRNSNNPRSSHK